MIRSGVVLKAELHDSILSALRTNERLAPGSAGEIYNAGFRAALLEAAEYAARERLCQPTEYDMQL